ncbi:MAG: sterol desaturase family protein [Bacteroidota bacterium]
MPHPLTLLFDPVTLIVVALYFALMLWETWFPAQQLPNVSWWKLKGGIAFALYFFLSAYLPLITDPYLAAFRLIDLSSLGNLGGAIVGTLIYELGVYIGHRCLHEVNFLWRIFHQMHHSAKRMDTFGAFFFRPLDRIGFTLLGSFSLSWFIGITPQAITIVLLLTAFLTIFQHANIHTPHWLGFFIQRPESHAFHHAKDIHKYNYSDLPFFDIFFDTFYNPKNYEHNTGFYPGTSDRVVEILLFKDISQQEIS